MTDYMSWDFLVGVGHSNPHVRCRHDPRDLFPDGLKMVFVSTEDGLAVDLLNRTTGRPWKNNPASPDLWGSGGNRDSLKNVKVDPFGGVNPVSVTEIRGGLRLMLPDQRPKVRLRGKYKVPQITSKSRTPTPVGATLAQIAERSIVTPKLSVSRVETRDPPISLPEAVSALNDWKGRLGGYLTLEITGDGYLLATAKYGVE